MRVCHVAATLSVASRVRHYPTMSDAARALPPLRRDAELIGLIGLAHGFSHLYQLAFGTMLLIARDRAGLDFAEVGTLVGLYYAVSGVFQTAAGFAVDRYGARPVLAGGLALAGIGMALVAGADSFTSLAVIAVIAGLGNSVFHPADFAILNASVTPSRLGRAYSVHGLGGSLGWAGAPVMYFLVQLLGWAGAALIAAVPGLLLAAAVQFESGRIADHRKPEVAGGEPAPASFGLFFQAPILVCLAYFVLVAANTVGVQNFAVPAWEKMFGVSQSHAALCLLVFIVGGAVGMIVGGIYADRVTRHDLIAAVGMSVAAVLTVPIAMQAIAPSMLLPLLALAGFAAGVTNPSRDMIVRGATPPGASGKVFGFVYSGLDIGSFLAPPVFGVLMHWGMPAAIFWIAITLYVVNALLVTTIRVVSPPRPAAA
ncbi:MAG: MFS transporter [Alphaproteobacteria bacterium]|nr:MFS transporter [Alphaproteobacteria bacterium]